MGFAEETGYVPTTIEQMMVYCMEGVNEQFGTTYTIDTFVGTNWYKYFYALMQRLQANEVKTAEIFLKMQDYFASTNETLSRPNTTSSGIVDYFATKGYLVSVKKPVDADAGKCSIAVDVDETLPSYAGTLKPLLCSYVKDCVVAGVVSQGTEEETITLANGQSFDFKYFLPDRIPVLLRLTLNISDNNLFTIAAPEVVKEILTDRIAELYRLGLNFEPQRYFSVADAPYCGSVLLEYSVDDGANWEDAVYVAEFDEVFTFDPIEDVEIVEV
jgi:hypothetical protein